MIRFGLKKFNVVLLIIFLTSCTNINVVKIDQDLLRVDKFDNKNQFVKSYFKKFDKETSQWLPANCNDGGVNILNLKSDDCEFTDMSLHMISIAKESDNIVKSSGFHVQAGLQFKVLMLDSFLMYRHTFVEDVVPGAKGFGALSLRLGFGL